ncbi:MAG: DUF4956 domain-containing protein [Propioniciclava sp.]|uniref:DUF4956 domain-containing protein n=1 Tax=Propioniciclava sp. TaxID=2038686 RepID=UPI0039E32F13
MTTLALIAIDLIAICTLTFALYFRRHRRRDLVAAFLGVNVGVLAVALVLSTSTAGLGLGLGLFGVLSIIRLRSTEISQREVAYYFASLALGLIAGIGTDLVISGALTAMIVAAMWAGDHPWLLRGAQEQTITLDRAIADEAELRSELASLLGGPVDRVTVQQLDLVRDLTVVDVRYRRADARTATATSTGARRPELRTEPAAGLTRTISTDAHDISYATVQDVRNGTFENTGLR